MKAIRFPVRALLVLGLCTVAAGCKKKDEVGAPLKAEVGAVAMPAPVLGFASLKSLDGLTKAVGEVVDQFQPGLGALLAGQVPALLQAKVLGLTSLSFLDLTKPVRIVMLDYQKFQNPLLLVVSHRGAEALNGGLPQTKAKGSPDNEWKYGGPGGQEVFVNRLGEDLVVFSFHQGSFPAAKPFLQELRRYPGTEILDVHVAGTNLNPIAESQIQRAREQIGQMAPAQDQGTPMGQMLQKELDMLSSLLKQMEAGRLVLRWDGAGLALEATVKATGDGGLARLAADMKNRRMDLYRRLPGEATMLIASNLDPQVFSSWSDLARDFWLESLQLTDEEKAQGTDLWNRMVALQGGDSAFYVGREGDFPFRVLSVTAYQDGAKAREAVLGLYQLLFRKAGTLVEKYAGSQLRELGPLDWTSMQTLLKSLEPTLRTAGIDASVQEVVQGDLKGDRLEFRIDYTKVPGAADKPEVQQAAQMIGNRLDGALVFGPKEMYFAMGKDSMAAIQDLAQGKAQAANVLDPLVQKAGYPVSVGAWVSLVDVLRLVAVFEPSLMEQLPGLADAKTGPGISLVAGSPGDRIVGARLDLPVSAVAGLTRSPAGQPAGAPVAPAPAP